MMRLLLEEASHDETFDSNIIDIEVDESTLEEDVSGSKPWGHVVAASFMVQVVTFAGLFVLSCAACLQRLRRRRNNNNAENSNLWSVMQTIVIPSFAGGALLATTFFLLMPEAMTLLGGKLDSHGEAHDSHDDEHRFLNEDDDHDEHNDNMDEGENQVAWKFGAALMGGYLFPILLGAIFPHQEEEKICDSCQLQEQELISKQIEIGAGDDRESSGSDQRTFGLQCENGECSHHHEDEESETERPKAVPQPKKQVINWTLSCSILVGDGFHNFCDGLFIGNSFMLCNTSIAYAIVGTTIYHELAQEIADFALLTNTCGLTIPQALAANFVSGFSVWIGAILILTMDLSEVATGTVLAISAGVYLQIACSECIPRVQKRLKTIKDNLVFLVCFVFGAVPIGLVLLNHGHCDGGHED